MSGTHFVTKQGPLDNVDEIPLGAGCSPDSVGAAARDYTAEPYAPPEAEPDAQLLARIEALEARVGKLENDLRKKLKKQKK